MLHREIVGLPTTVYPVDEWALVECEVDPDYLARAETIFSLSNGYVGLRGAPDEGRPQHDLGTFVNGFHETWPITHAEEAFGFARTGQTIVAVPDARRFHLYVDDEPLQLPVADIESFERRLDMRAGELTRELVWRTPSGKRVQVRSRRLVSMSHRHLVAFRYEVTMLDGEAPVVVSSQLRHEAATDESGRMVGDVFDPSTDVHLVGPDGSIDDPRRPESLGDVLICEGHEHHDGRGVLRYATTASGMTLACGIDHRVISDVAVDADGVSDRARAKTVFSADLGSGQSLVIEKVAAYATSRSAPSKRLADRVNRVLDRAMDRTYDDLATEQADWFAAFWEAGDVVIEDNPVVQQAVRWSLFQLVQAAARAEGTGIPAKGLTGSGYEGHYFWDTEVYVLPYLTYTMPRAARNLLRFRYTLLDAARHRAREVNQDGALFAWRTINGEEASAYYEAGTAQYHINADVVYAIRKYVLATGDTDFLVNEGAEILVETARLWADLGFFRSVAGNDSETFHIHGVTGPDEYTTVVNDNAYTNLMARLNLRYAVEVVEFVERDHPEVMARLRHRTNLHPDEVAAWRRAADAMYVPHDDRLGITPQDEHFLEKQRWDFEATPRDRYPLLLHFHPLVIYRHQVIKQADIVLAMLLLPGEFDADLKRRNFDYYDPLTTGDSSLSASTQSIMAAELGDATRALEYFRFGLFIDLADVAGNVADGVHVAAAGGVWQTLVHGFAGFRDDDDIVAFDPRLPSNWSRMSFAITTHSGRVRVAMGRLAVTYSLEVGQEMVVRHRDEVLVLRQDVPITRDLTAGVPVEV